MNWFYLTLAILTFVAGLYFLFKGSPGFKSRRNDKDAM